MSCLARCVRAAVTAGVAGHAAAATAALRPVAAATAASSSSSLLRAARANWMQQPRRDYNVGGNEVKAGSTIKWEDKTYLVLSTTVNMRGRAHTTYNLELKDVGSTSKISVKVRPADKIEVIELTPVRMNYLYRQGTTLVFMDPVSFEQIEVSASLCGRESRANYLIENSSTLLTRNGDTFVKVAVPEKAVCTVETTAPAKAGGKVNDPTGKDAKLTNGLTVQVPAFIESGAHIVVNTETDAYVGKSEVPPMPIEEEKFQ